MARWDRKRIVAACNCPSLNELGDLLLRSAGWLELLRWRRQSAQQTSECSYGARKSLLDKSVAVQLYSVVRAAPRLAGLGQGC